MAVIRLAIEHNGKIFEPPIKDSIKLEWERTGSPGKLTFTTVKIKNADMNFAEGDTVWLYYDGEVIFKGYVFTKKRDREQHIQVTCYDQLRYLKNKFSYAFEKKTATEIVQAICKDYGLKTGTLDNTKYAIPTLMEENQSALDIILSALEETLVNTGEMYVLYDDCGEICLRNVTNMVTNVLICEQTAENIDYTSSIDDETYNSIVLYYDPTATPKSSALSGGGGGGGGGGSSSGSSIAGTIIAKARSQLGVKEVPAGSNNVKYNTEYYGRPVRTASGKSYAWCCVFVWWVFKSCGLSSRFMGGGKTASVSTAMSWFKSQGKFLTSGFKPGDIVFWSGHMGIIESVRSDNNFTTIEGNYGDKVSRVNRTRSGVLGVGRP